MKRLLLIFAIFSCGCGSMQTNMVFAANGTVVASPTQLTSDQSGNYIVTAGSLYGLPASTGQGVKIHGNVLVTGPALLQDLYIDGCLKIDRANRVELMRVWVQGCAADGIDIVSDPGNTPNGDQSCCAKLAHVMSVSNGGAGLRLTNTADVFISNSEFENNKDCGARLVNSPTERIVNSDFGGNTICGLIADSKSGMLMLSNNQYGNNHGDDLVLQSQNNIINSQEFIGPPGFCAVRFVGAQQWGTNFFGPRSICGVQ